MILDKIVKRKKERLAYYKYKFDIRNFSEGKIGERASFYDALARDGLSIIGEIKKASPSRGIIREDFSPEKLAVEYGESVDCLSVLTEEDFFLGSLKYLKEVARVSKLPIIRKDFITSPLEIFEAKECGASAVLLIVAILSGEVLRDFIKLARGLGMDALVEVHDEKELEVALHAGAYIVGINNRNLNDFSESLDTTIRLAERIPRDKIIVSESSIHTKEDIVYLKKSGISAVLVGESFMRCENISEKAREFKDAFR